MDAVTTRDKWNRIHQRRRGVCPPAATVLAENSHLLPPDGGTALDIACGLGGNALFLARRGFIVDAVDIADTATHAVATAAHAENLPVNALTKDISAWEMATARYDVIVVSRFLERSLTGAIISALKSGGLLFYQTFTETRIHVDGPSNPSFLLRDNELLRLFEGLLVRYYREEARAGKLDRGNRDLAFLIAQKP
ncbi:MAG: methyltransferase domain-containing protein [Methylococcus sp.]|nr:methyltransferase domain-containing protein [Methylococcus sp.]